MKNNSKSLPPLVVVLPGIPFPLNQGYRIAAFNNLRRLQNYFSLEIIVWQLDRNYKNDDLAGFKNTINGVSVRFVNGMEVIGSAGQKICEKFQNAVEFKNPFVPFNVHKLHTLIRQTLLALKANDVYFEMSIGLFVQTALLLQKSAEVNILFALQNIESNAYYAGQINILQKWNIFQRILLNIRKWFDLRDELHALRDSKKVITIAHADSVYLKSRNISNVLLPITLPEITPNRRTKKQVRTIGILGDLSPESSGNGFSQFLSVSVPIIREAVPEAHIKINGKGLSASDSSVLQYMSSVTYTEFSEDIEEFWNSIDMLAVPILIARGVRIRILEAILHKIPIVSTVEASTGFEKAESFLCIAENFEEFGRYCVELLQNDRRYNNQVALIDDYYQAALSENAVNQKWKSEFFSF